MLNDNNKKVSFLIDHFNTSLIKISEKIVRGLKNNFYDTILYFALNFIMQPKCTIAKLNKYKEHMLNESWKCIIYNGVLYTSKVAYYIALSEMKKQANALLLMLEEKDILQVIEKCIKKAKTILATEIDIIASSADKDKQSNNKNETLSLLHLVNDWKDFDFKTHYSVLYDKNRVTLIDFPVSPKA